MTEQNPEYMNGMEWRIEGLKSEYDEKFEKARRHNSRRTFDIHDKFLNELKKEELTYREAYAVLQLLHLSLKYESEFLNLRQ